jgi:hypothetical protein
MVLSACFTGITWANSKWDIQTINQDADTPGFIALDSKNNPHILYHPSSGHDVASSTSWDIYVSYNGYYWTGQKLFFDGMIAGTSLALDSHDNPHVLCYGVINYTLELLYASWTGTSWTFQMVDGYYNIYSPPLVLSALAFDSEGNPHIAYTVNTGAGGVVGENELKYAVLNKTGWELQTIDDNVDDGGPRFCPHGISLGVDSTGNAHVMYSKTNQVTYAFSTLQGWNKQVIVNNATFGNMVLDSHGYPHLVYISSNNSLMYSEWNGSYRNTQRVASDADSAYLALDSQDQPHVNYLIKGNLIYASIENGSWVLQTVDNTASSAGPLAMDSNEKPHISYGGISGPYFSSYQMYGTKALIFNLFEFLIIIATIVLLVIAVSVYVWRKTSRNSFRSKST